MVEEKRIATANDAEDKGSQVMAGTNSSMSTCTSHLQSLERLAMCSKVEF
jgi:hypothetical protein